LRYLDWTRAHVRILRPVCASPRGWSFTGNHSKLLTQMRLIRKSASKRNIAQGHIGLQHILGSQFDATPNHKGMRGVSERASKGARKVCFAAPHQSA
jgi:hypothetical protein